MLNMPLIRSQDIIIFNSLPICGGWTSTLVCLLDGFGVPYSSDELFC